MIEEKELRRIIHQEQAPLKRLVSEKRLRRVIADEIKPLEVRLAAAEELAQTARREAAVAIMGYEMVKEGMEGLNESSNRRWIDIHNTTERGFAELKAIVQQQNALLAQHTQVIERVTGYEKVARGAGRLALALPVLRWARDLFRFLVLTLAALAVALGTAVLTVQLLY